MKIFISWSGEPSKRVARALRSFLQDVNQHLDPWMSDTDIGAGARWGDELAKQLEETEFGIICVTREALNSPWMLFEVGALSKSVKRARVCPYLIGLDHSDLSDPLKQFQWRKADADGTLSMLNSINELMGAGHLSEERIQRYFVNFWPNLKKEIEKIEFYSNVQLPTLDSEAYIYDAFLSTPMAACANNEEFKIERRKAAVIFKSLKKHCGFKNIYWASEHIFKMEDFDAMGVAIDADLQAIRQSRYFVLFYPRPIPTSALFEAGYALALNKTCVFFSKRDDLPWLMRKIADVYENVMLYDESEWETPDDIEKLLSRNKCDIFSCFDNKRR